MQLKQPVHIQAAAYSRLHEVATYCPERTSTSSPRDSSRGQHYFERNAVLAARPQLAHQLLEIGFSVRQARDRIGQRRIAHI